MWLLFHRKEGTKTVVDGRSFSQECPTCQKTTRFAEVEITENYGVWFVDVIGDSERAYRCMSCGDVFDLRDEAPAAKPVVPERTQRQQQIDRVEQLASEQRRRDAEAAKHRAKVATRIDDELAELKKRMGR